MCISFYTYAQNRNANIIILVDGEIIKYTYVKIGLENGEIIKGTIQPGKLQLKESDYKVLEGSQIKSFQFTYSSSCKGESESKTYEIDDFKLSWLDQPYVIIYVYNTDNNKYKKIYNPLPGKSYTYDYEIPGGTMKRVQKSFTKDQKKCQYNNK
ncbi:hypothetical protein CJF12_04600 [Chryseobacterium piperi]|nr:hypothetical protein CJF12_04600 [Chryseobacterium piperi]